MIPSVNYHLWEPCNMRCKFCFATFQDVKQSILPKGHLLKDQSIEVIHQLAEIGFEKITFAGGEPTLCPWLSDLIRTAKELKMTTMIVTNGSKLTDKFLLENQNHLDWIALSVDSLNENTNLLTGRAISGRRALNAEYYKQLTDKIKHNGYGLKINTVVSSKNYHENMFDFIEYAKPQRWKVFQVLPIKGQNDIEIEDFVIDKNQFHQFLKTHSHLNSSTVIVPESNSEMKGTYVMVDPAGRFYDNSKGKHSYSKPILEVGSRLAIQEMNYDFIKFINRQGIYDWSKPKYIPKKITMSGEALTGKSTIGKALADKLNFDFISIGNSIREIAAKQNKTIVEFQEYCLVTPQADELIDKEFSSKANSLENVIIDYRLGFKFIQNAFHILLTVSNDDMVRRLEKAGRKDETIDKIYRRNALFKKQFKNSYGIEDYTDRGHYDLVVNTSDFKSEEEIADFILSFFKGEGLL